MTCDCKCHKENAVSNLKKCEEKNKRSKKELEALKKKILALTVAVAIVGTLIGKEGVDKVLEYLETFDKVKQSTSKLLDTSSNDFEILPPVYYGSSPSPSTIGVFALSAILPTKRRS